MGGSRKWRLFVFVAQVFVVIAAQVFVVAVVYAVDVFLFPCWLDGVLIH